MAPRALPGERGSGCRAADRPPGAIPRPGGMPGAEAKRGGRTDRERALARAAVAAWIGFLRRTIEDEGFARRFGVPLTVMEVVVGEMIALARRADIEGAIAADLRAWRPSSGPSNRRSSSP